MSVQRERRRWRVDRVVTTTAVKVSIVVAGALAIGLIYGGATLWHVLAFTHETFTAYFLVALFVVLLVWAFVRWRLSREVRATQVIEGLMQEGGAIRRELREIETPAPLLGRVRRRHVEQVGPTEFLYAFRLPPGPDLKVITSYQGSFDLVMKCQSYWWDDGSLVWVRLGTGRIPSSLRWQDVNFKVEGILPIVMGHSAFGRVVIDLAKSPFHIVVGGTTGSGKTGVGRSIIVQLTCRRSAAELELELFDLKGGTGLGIFEPLPHMRGRQVITDIHRASQRLQELVDLMAERLERIKAANEEDIVGYNERHPRRPLPYILIVIDEMFSFDPDGAPAGPLKIARTMAQNRLGDLANQGRAAGFECVFMTQRPDRKVLPGQVQNNVTGRLAFHTGDRYGSETLLGAGDTDATHIQSDPPGLAIWKTESMRSRMRTVWIPRALAVDIVDRLRRGEDVDLEEHGGTDETFWRRLLNSFRVAPNRVQEADDAGEYGREDQKGGGPAPDQAREEAGEPQDDQRSALPGRR